MEEQLLQDVTRTVNRALDATAPGAEIGLSSLRVALGITR